MTFTYHARKGVSSPVQLLLGAVGIVIVLTLIIFLPNKKTDVSEDLTASDETVPVTAVENIEAVSMDVDIETGELEETIDLDEGEFVYTADLLAGINSPLLDFNENDYLQALQSQKTVLLYFYSNWGPVCKKEVTEALYPAFNELQTDKVVGFRINYNDNETSKVEGDLAKEYGVSYQHTKIILQNKVEVVKAAESWTKDQFLKTIASLNTEETL